MLQADRSLIDRRARDEATGKYSYILPSPPHSLKKYWHVCAHLQRVRLARQFVGRSYIRTMAVTLEYMCM